jgi:hypothetical protein
MIEASPFPFRLRIEQPVRQDGLEMLSRAKFGGRL